MTDGDRLALVRDCYTAWEAADRATVERVLGDEFTFSSPPDPMLDRAGYFERCWPGAGSVEHFMYLRLIPIGDEVLVTYDATRRDGTHFQNTEIFGFAGDLISRTEVYFGWDLA